MSVGSSDPSRYCWIRASPTVEYLIVVLSSLLPASFDPSMTALSIFDFVFCVLCIVVSLDPVTFIVVYCCVLGPGHGRWIIVFISTFLDPGTVSWQIVDCCMFLFPRIWARLLDQRLCPGILKSGHCPLANSLLLYFLFHRIQARPLGHHLWPIVLKARHRHPANGWLLYHFCPGVLRSRH